MITYAAPCLRPNWVKVNRARGAKAAGLRFERLAAKALPMATHGQWFHYTLHGEPHWCQFDLLLEGAKTVVVIEVKLTDYHAAMDKLTGLYIPVARKAFPQKEVKALALLRHATNIPSGVKIYESVTEAMRDGCNGVVHWLGHGHL